VPNEVLNVPVLAVSRAQTPILHVPATKPVVFQLNVAVVE